MRTCKRDLKRVFTTTRVCEEPDLIPRSRAYNRVWYREPGTTLLIGHRHHYLQYGFESAGVHAVPVSMVAERIATGL